MAYPDGDIDVNAPADSDALSQGDDEIRKFKRQIVDRLGTLVVDINADPLELIPAGAVGPTSHKKIVTASAFLNDLKARENDLDLGNGVIVGFVGNDLFADLGPYLPNGATITLLEWIIDKTGGPASVSATLRRKQFASGNPAEAIINTTNIGVSGDAIVASTVLAHVVDENYGYWLRTHGNGSAGQAYKIYGCRITYDV